jgi:hypothetical protein
LTKFSDPYRTIIVEPVREPVPTKQPPRRPVAPERDPDRRPVPAPVKR